MLRAQMSVDDFKVSIRLRHAQDPQFELAIAEAEECNRSQPPSSEAESELDGERQDGFELHLSEIPRTHTMMSRDKCFRWPHGSGGWNCPSAAGWT